MHAQSVSSQPYARGRSSPTILLLLYFFLLRPPPCSTLFPYTTLFRSIGTLVGPVLGAMVFILIQEVLSSYTEHWMIFTGVRSEEHTSELQSLAYLVCRLLLEKKNTGHHAAPAPCEP